MNEKMKKQIDYIMDRFNFRRVHKAMQALNWTWAGPNSIPDEYNLRMEARRLLMETTEMDIGWSVGTGGFIAAKKEDRDGEYLSLVFHVEEQRGFNEETEE